MPLLVGLALLSMAAGARYGHPAPVPAASVGASAPARIVPADLTPRGPIPVFESVVEGEHRTALEGTSARGGADQWGAYRAPIVTVESIPAFVDEGRPHAVRPSDDLRTTAPTPRASRAPPIA